jgi:hypothetical protein
LSGEKKEKRRNDDYKKEKKFNRAKREIIIKIKSGRTANMMDLRKKLMEYPVLIFYYRRIYKKYIHMIYY